MDKRINYKRIIPVAIAAIVLAVTFRSVIFASYVVEGESMEPTLYDGSMLMVNKVVYDVTEVDRFDVIVFRATEEEDYVKRVIGLPGDTMIYENGKLYINGKYMEEDFLDSYAEASGVAPETEDFTLSEVTGEKQVPEGHLFVMGDNREDSRDSREFGFVSVEQLVGKVDVTYWPLSEAKLSYGN
ncbi:signal peptidase I [Lentibacillus sediminis]|uniref:signal peptidase I n=1 Tax=Lentibacillus sediminis TaxID=1940529 RepID=UPI000C1C1604|nr:signal peptidase I [Lentibacillus sediminis]